MTKWKGIVLCHLALLFFSVICFHGILLFQTQRVRPPWENCTFGIDEKTGSAFSRDKCSFDCYTEKVVHNCSCRLLHMTAEPSVRICSPKETTCASAITKDIRAGFDECAASCRRTACTEEEFDLMTSEAPFSQYFLSNKADLLNMTLAQVEKNLVGFEVYFSQMTEKHIQNVKAYGPFDLFCDIGGALGLLLGASIATVLECADFFLRHQYVKYIKKTSL